MIKHTNTMNKEFLKMQKLANLITESEYKEKLEEVSPNIMRNIKLKFSSRAPSDITTIDYKQYINDKGQSIPGYRNISSFLTYGKAKAQEIAKQIVEKIKEKGPMSPNELAQELNHPIREVETICGLLIRVMNNKPILTYDGKIPR